MSYVGTGLASRGRLNATKNTMGIPIEPTVAAAVAKVVAKVAVA